MKTASSTATQVESTPFALDLSNTPFDLKPTHEIVVSASGRKLLIYETLEKTTTPDRSQWDTPIKAWRLVQVTKTGRIVNFSRYDNEGKVYTDPLLLALAIRSLSQDLSKVKKTTVECSDTEE